MFILILFYTQEKSNIHYSNDRMRDCSGYPEGTGFERHEIRAGTLIRRPLGCPSVQ